MNWDTYGLQIRKCWGFAQIFEDAGWSTDRGSIDRGSIGNVGTNPRLGCRWETLIVVSWTHKVSSRFRTLTWENSFKASEAAPGIRSRTTIDQEASVCSIRSRTSSIQSPNLKLTRTVWTAAGSNSESDLQVLMAAAANAPLHKPSRYVSDGRGYARPHSPCWLRWISHGTEIIHC
jgi:hypothetical protein